jgi:hypothetical protein
MDEPTRPPDAAESDRDRTIANLALLLIFAAVVGIGAWLANAMLDARRADECITQGRRNCTPIDVPPRSGGE